MKPPSRTALLLSSILAGLLLAGVMSWQTGIRRRQYTERNGEFEQKYRRPVDALRLAQDAVNDRFRNNGNNLTEIKNSAPVAAKKTVVQQDATSLAAVILQGISWGLEKPVAMVNSKVYQKGDCIGGFTVEEIRARSILLSSPDGTETEITLIKSIL
jgi:hypothetical protein